jgi:hypothetical protein
MTITQFFFWSLQAWHSAGSFLLGVKEKPTELLKRRQSLSSLSMQRSVGELAASESSEQAGSGASLSPETSSHFRLGGTGEGLRCMWKSKSDSLRI